MAIRFSRSGSKARRSVSNSTPPSSSAGDIFPIALVVAHQHLIVQTIDLGLDRGHIGGEVEEFRNRGDSEKPQALRQMGWRTPGVTSDREPPLPETGNIHVIWPGLEACLFQRIDNAPIGLARKHGRRALDDH